MPTTLPLVLLALSLAASAHASALLTSPAILRPEDRIGFVRFRKTVRCGHPPLRGVMLVIFSLLFG
jgi:hypothetical protein